MLVASLVVRLRLKAGALSALRPGRDGLTPPARRVRGVRGVRGERDRPARLSASAREVAPCRRSLQHPRARSPPAFKTPAARCTLLGPPRALRGPALVPPRPAGCRPHCQCRKRRRESKAERRRDSSHSPRGGAARLVVRLLRWGNRAGAVGGYGRSIETTDFKTRLS